MTLRRGDIVTVKAETLSRHGDGVARHGDGEQIWEIHVAGLFPHESADVVLENISRQRPRAHGRLVEIRHADRDRRRPPCPHHGPCSGCALMELEIAGQHRAKLMLTRERHRVPVDKVVGMAGENLHYRWSSKRVVGGRPGNLTLGSFGRGTHRIADMSGCMVDHPDLVRGLNELVTVANALGVVPYDESAGTGDLRYVWARTDGRGNVLMTLVTVEARSFAAETIAERLQVPSGVAWAIQPSLGNDMRGVTVRPLRGRQSLKIAVAGFEREIGPLGFLQPNPSMAAVAYRELVSMPAGGVLRGRKALDLYAGVGITTDLLRSRFDEVVPCEAFPESARQLGVAPELVESFLARQLSRPESVPDLVVANPPRGGLGSTVCDQLNRLHAPRLHIMSCSPQSLYDDIERLTGPAGSYRLLAARAYDTLPHTPHVEVVAWLVGR